ncbi:glyoxylase-like metal-dependent hydrolase (beta-lactamase superfamily II) [Thermocatellispora tengchongensis]|uniref:Glyoxylase-like metal-dependent hydrolase (Beta-lactamase superfamily II) n=1 Tax=Thermocatellispora tengchongensis TaxID=1073253 RepID=A0A840NX49_9ACTN|nr:MBL fold metallo-hydrolase [Thermocatellispora tengchongensis]MBB5131369.1 glyoxylase-like metal-dependent hydrolase (beta-lactamase superfamily II) [Thermocatellispora tengchongensis]
MIHRFAVGDLPCAVISDGQPEPPWEPALETFFTPGTGVPPEELRAAVAAEGRGRTTVRCGYNCLCVETPAGLTVIDTGLGRDFGGYGPEVAPLVGRFGERLAEAGFSAADAVAVVFTHLHEDHVRGAMWPGEPAFPRATLYAHAAEVAFWSGAPPSVPPDQREPALEAIRVFGERLRPVEYGVEIMPQVRAVEAAGHTPGHMAVLLESRGQRLLCTGDSFHDPLQLGHPTWRTPWDADAERSVRSRRALLEWAAAENLLVLAYHLPFPGLGRIARDGDAFAWRPIPA